MSKVNVLYVTHSNKKGGAEQSLIHLMNYLDVTKYNVYLMCPENTEYLDEITIPIKVIPMELGTLKEKWGAVYLKKIFSIQKIIRDHHIHIVHANGWRAPWYAAPLKILTKAKTIWHHRDNAPSKMYNYLLPFFFHKIICISEYVKGTIDKRHENRCVVVYNGIDPQKTTYSSNKKPFKLENQFVVGVFGRIVEWKRLDVIIDGIKRLKDRIGDGCKLCIVGGTAIDGSENYLNQLKNQVKALGLENNVVFYGHVKNPLEMMSQCDVTVNYSDREPFGRVIIESLLANTPVIVADSGGAPEIIRHTHGGLISKDGDPESLAENLEKVYHMTKEEYTALSEEGHRNVMKKFNMSHLIKEIEEVYEKLLKR